MATKFYNISTNDNLAENSNILVPSQKAVRNFIASKSIQLDYLQSTQPTTFSIGQKWLDTINKLLYTAINSSNWGVGKSIETDQFFTFNDLLYYYDGTSINSYSTLSITEQNQGSEIKVWFGTRAEYQALTNIDSTTVYNVIESNIDYAFLATQTEFNNSSSTTAATPYQVNQALGNYLPKAGGNLDAEAVLRLTNANNEVSTLAFNTSGQLTISSSLYVANEANVNNLVVRNGVIYKTNTSSGITAIWSNDYASTSNFGIVKPDGTTITINDGVISASGTGQLANTASGTNALTILGAPASDNEATNVGLGSEATTGATSIGYNSKATASNAIQIGTGTNNTANTVQIGSYQILGSTGTIPNARIPAATSTALGGVILEYDSSTNTLNIKTS